jgi:hypothetical protein
MTENAPAEGNSRRRLLLRVGRFSAILILLYLAVSWLYTGGRPAGKAGQPEFQGIWLSVRPVWLYPTILLAGIVLFLAFVVWPIAGRLPSRGSWRELVGVQATFAQQQLEILCARGGPDCQPEHSPYAATKQHLEAACRAARHEPRASGSRIDELVDVWTGASVEAAFRNLHAAEVSMVPLLPVDELRARIPEVLARLRKCAADDPRRRAAERNLREGMAVPRLRAEYANALRYGYEVKDTEHARVREFRNILLSATAGLSLVVAIFCVVGASFPDATPLCFAPPVSAGATTTTLDGQENTVCPSEEQPPGPRKATSRRLPAPGDVSLVALFGLLGGALSGAFAIRKIRGQSTPYAVPVALSLLKLPSGSLTAIVGILLVRGEFVPGLSQLDNQPQILAYAFFFGAAQQVATRFVDERAREVLGRVPDNATPPAATKASASEH